MPKSRKSRSSSIKKETEALHYAQVVIQRNMLGIVTELEAIKANNNGKLPYGAITNMVKAQNKVYLPWLPKKKVDYWLRKAGASAVPNMGILSGDSQADMRSFYYSSSRKSTLTREEDDKRHDSR